jgi:hypothetical protein
LSRSPALREVTRVESGVIQDADVDIGGGGRSDTAAEEGLFGHVDDVAQAAVERRVSVGQEFVGFPVRHCVAGPVIEELRQRGGAAEYEHVDVEFVAQEVLERGRVANGGVMDLGCGEGLGGWDAFTLGSFQFQLDAFLLGGQWDACWPDAEAGGTEKMLKAPRANMVGQRNCPWYMAAASDAGMRAKHLKTSRM